MKLSIAIANTNALPSAFVVYRGFETCIPQAARLGFHGVELALRRADEIDTRQLVRLLDDNQLEVSCISTGQVYADGGLMLTHDQRTKREEVKAIFRDFIDLAADFGQNVNIGRVRGPIQNRPLAYVEDLFAEVVRELCAYAQPKNVTLILEPVNRYETDFINSVEEGAALLKKVNCPNLLLMPDIFHMNIEDRSIGAELTKHIDAIQYIHVADSNRLAPGQGHLDFPQLFETLFAAGYDGWISAEILPHPSPDVAAQQTADFLLPLLKTYNEARTNVRLAERLL